LFSTSLVFTEHALSNRQYMNKYMNGVARVIIEGALTDLNRETAERSRRSRADDRRVERRESAGDSLVISRVFLNKRVHRDGA
jgi:hypothetical protein